MSRHLSCTRLPFSLIRDQGNKGRAAASVFAAFRESGMEARIVGGYVRDALSGAPPGDIGMAVNALPDRFIPTAPAAKGRGRGKGDVWLQCRGRSCHIPTFPDGAAGKQAPRLRRIEASR